MSLKKYQSYIRDKPVVLHVAAHLLQITHSLHHHKPFWASKWKVSVILAELHHGETSSPQHDRTSLSAEKNLW